MVLIDHPQQQDVPPDGTPSPEAQPRGRHAAPPDDAGARRLHRRRRWPILAAVAALGVLVVPPPGPHQRTVVAEVADDSALPDGPLIRPPTISFLSSGAPTGSIVLASAPTQVGDQAPIAPTVISGLAANGIPNVALNAYRVAAARMANSSPVLRHRLVAARRHRPRRVQPRPLRRRHAQLRRHVHRRRSWARR